MLTLILFAGTAQCGSTSDAPRGQALLFIDTDAPLASMASDQPFLTDASVDTLRVDILAPDNSIVRSVDFAAPDEANWPVSFGIRGISGAVVSRLRLRAFRAQRSAISTNTATGAKEFEPIAGYSIDRVVEVPVPNERGVFGFRVVLRSECRGQRPDFTRRTNCVAQNQEDASFRDGIESVPVDPNPPREKMWWPADPRRNADGTPVECEDVVCPNDSVCIPGGFFMLGDLRVVGFGASRAYDAVPPHPVAMHRFCLDRTEFTVDRFQNRPRPLLDNKTGIFDPAGKQLCTWIPPIESTEAIYPGGAPMNCLTWEEAQKACEDAGGRLPTEAEWEYVATGLGRASLFPWSDEPPTCATAVLEQQATAFVFFPQCGNDGIVAVDNRESAREDIVTIWPQPDGKPSAEVWHMGGSMSEWTYDSFSSYADTTDVANCWQSEGVFPHPSCQLDDSGNRSVRGGNYQDALEFAYSALRRNEPRSPSVYIGFRCAYPVGSDTDPVTYVPGNRNQSDPGDENPGVGPGNATDLGAGNTPNLGGQL